MRKLIVVKQLSLKYGDELAEILSTDKKLHKELSPNSKLTTINGLEYVQGCIKWETKKRGRCFAIVKNDRAVGSISFVHKDDEIASLGYWIKSDAWGQGICTQAFKQMLLIVKELGYASVTASILKENIASKKIWEKYNATFKEDDERYYPIIKLS